MRFIMVLHPDFWQIDFLNLLKFTEIRDEFLDIPSHIKRCNENVQKSKKFKC